MKNRVLTMVMAALGLAVQLAGQEPLLKITPAMELLVYGQVGNYYQIESSTNLVSWSPRGAYFSLLSAPSIQAVNGVGEKQEFFRARALVSATNNSFADVCAEHDNVNVALRGDVRNFSVIATHPIYQPTDFTCLENFSNCPPDDPGTNYAFTPLIEKVYDNGTDYMMINREASFWRPRGMSVSMDGTRYYDDIHFIELGRRIPGANEWPKFFVLYSDGNMRLIPFPPEGQPSVCFGSSIIIGPASIAVRPFVDIASVDYRSASRTLLITYRAGGTTILDVNSLSRNNATVKVTVNYPTDQPFCTFRSMFVSDGNSDCDQVQWQDFNGQINSDPILSFSGTVGTEWFFNRQTQSGHNQSAPDLKVVLY